MTSAAYELIAANASAAYRQVDRVVLTAMVIPDGRRPLNSSIVFGEADPPKKDISEICPCQNYGVAAAVAAGTAGAGAGVVPKLKFTVGAFSAPACAPKNGFAEKPSIPAMRLVGKVFTATLKFCTAVLKLFRSTEIRFSVPSSCACNVRKFWFAFSSG